MHGPVPGDDAGGGRRGLRPVATEALLRSVETAYGLTIDGVADLGGSVNLNLRLDTGPGPYVLRVYRRSGDADRVRTIQRGRAALREAGIPTATLAATTTGDTVVETEVGAAELELFRPWDEKMDVLPRVVTALPTLGAVHDALRPLDLGPAADVVDFANQVAAHDLVDRVRRGTDRLRAWAPTAEERAMAMGAERLAAEATAAHAGLHDLLPPHQLTHGDFWDNNVLFRRGRLVLVADLDFLSRRSRIDDLALILFFTRYLFGEPPAPADLAPLLTAYEAGAATPLTSAERAALPIALARQPLWSFAVWVALLDDETTARRHLDGHGEAIQWGLSILGHLDRWQQTFS